MLESVSTTQHVHQSLRAEVHPEAINCAERGRSELLHGHVLATQLLRLHDFQSVKLAGRTVLEEVEVPQEAEEWILM